MIAAWRSLDLLESAGDAPIIRMLNALLINWLAFLCFAALVGWARFRLEILERKIEAAKALESLLEPKGMA